MVRPLVPEPDLGRAVAAALGAEIVSWQSVAGGFSAAGLWIIETATGDTWFVKAATTDDTARFLRAEMMIYGELEAPFLPRITAWQDDDHRPFLVMEDLSQWHWPPPWDSSHIHAVLQTCAAIAAIPPPTLLGGIDASLLASYWPGIAAGPEPIHALGVASPAWFEQAVPSLIAAEESAVLSGESLVHSDIRSDNLCMKHGQVKVIDWNWACVGNPAFDVVAWLPSLRLEGGPVPWDLLDGGAPLVARLAGFFLHHATLPPNPMVRPDLRSFQRAQGAVALEWAAHELGLEPPSS